MRLLQVSLLFVLLASVAFSKENATYFLEKATNALDQAEAFREQELKLISRSAKQTEFVKLRDRVWELQNSWKSDIRGHTPDSMIVLETRVTSCLIELRGHIDTAGTYFQLGGDKSDWFFEDGQGNEFHIDSVPKYEAYLSEARGILTRYEEVDRESISNESEQ